MVTRVLKVAVMVAVIVHGCSNGESGDDGGCGNEMVVIVIVMMVVLMVLVIVRSWYW